ncbi:DUF3488 and transglutaminase-like domain-containing protein [Salinisphaera sp. Q1T1-3]|uniref:DUF3488 and transglutaminase-like domain-containing protein n=1 Tax=Salinisphaera sp. Q1T1-3 TaxID=2321229 RepID=UPI000E71A0DB|nr:DUF3488 and transglutaminase-like domain-containing protein [Salinisphaera sp. Q1T1-3]RJS93773.1 DUF3488 domain-containing protein [Salinisphaera sp. Q1T1-3]
MSRHVSAMRLGTRERGVLVGLVALIMAPHVMHLPWWVSALVAALLIWQGIALARRHRPPPLIVRALLTAACFAGVFAAFGRVNGQDAGVSLLVLMLGLKLSELTRARDAYVVLTLCCFVLATQFLFSQSMAMAASLVIGVWAVIAAFVYLHTLPGAHRSGHALRESAALLGLAVPIAVALFLLFPRLPGPLWGLPANDGRTGLTGLSDRMSPGAIERLARSGAVAFRARFDGPVPSPDQRYWRGPVFWDLAGGTWQNRAAPPPPGDVEALSAPLRIDITLEPNGKRWLLALDAPLKARPGDGRTTGGTLVAEAPIKERIRYVERSATSYRLGLDLSPATRRRALALPTHGNPRARALAQRWAAAADSTPAIVNQARALFRHEPFRYTLSPPRTPREDSIDAFLFRTRAGFCEHYAGAFTFLMRAAGVPARVVTGFLGARKADYGDYWIVRNADAHAWSEVWIAGRGWVRVDPTAAVAPARIDDSIAAAVADRGDLAFMARGDDRDPWFQARMAWDGINAAWNQWFLAYGPALQEKLFSRLGLGGFGPALAVLTGLIVAALGLISLLLAWRMRPTRSPDGVVRAWLRVERRLARRGLIRITGETPGALAARAVRRRPSLAPELPELAAQYTQMRYAYPAPGPAARRAFMRRAARFRIGRGR